MAERADGQPVTIGDCTRISRALSPVLDAADPVAGGYALEVSSAGLDRPLVRPADFERFAGQRIELKAVRPIEGRKRFRGRLVGIAGDDIVVEAEDGTRRVPYEALAEAHLSTDDATTVRRRPPSRH